MRPTVPIIPPAPPAPHAKSSQQAFPDQPPPPSPPPPPPPRRVKEPLAPRGGLGGPAEPAPPPRDFYQALPGAFLYPATPGGMLGILFGGVAVYYLYYALGHAGALNNQRFVCATGILLLAGYFVAFLLKIVLSSSRGDADLPEWPGLHNLDEDVLRPLGLCLAATLGCAAPGGAYMLAAGAAWHDPMALALFGAGLLVWPLTMLSVAMFRSTGALNPVFLCLTFLRVPVPYLVACAAMLAGCALGWFFEVVLHGCATCFVVLYVLLVSMRVMGLLYFTHRARFGWFEHHR